MEITRVPLDSLVLDPKNARQHGDRNLEAIQGSLQAFGQIENLVVQKSSMKVIGGNGRVAAMRAKGDTHAYVVMLDVDDTEAAKLGIALNRTSELATWDFNRLEELISEIKDNDVSLDDIGFSDAEIDAILSPKMPISDDTDYANDNNENKKDIKWAVCPHCNEKFPL